MAEEVAGAEGESTLPPNVQRALQAVKAGVVGTAVLLFVLTIGSVETRFSLGVPAAIAQFVGMPGQLYLGFAVFVAAGVVVWPLLFRAVEGSIPSDDVGVRGILFALVLWLAFLALGSTGVQLGTELLVLYLAFTLLAHVAYGYTLGVLYGRFSGKSARPRQSAQQGSSSESNR